MGTRKPIGKGFELVTVASALVVFGWLAYPTGGAALTGSLTRDPADIVRKYVSLDTRGARLEAMTWEALKPYINWKQEPVWGHLLVINGYEVVDDVKQWNILSMEEAVIPVKYRILGVMYWNTASFLAKPEEEVVGFRVKAVGNRWRIVEPMIPPHVGQKRLLNYVRQAILDERDQAHLARLTALRDQLRNIR